MTFMSLCLLTGFVLAGVGAPRNNGTECEGAGASRDYAVPDSSESAGNGMPDTCKTPVPQQVPVPLFQNPNKKLIRKVIKGLMDDTVWEMIKQNVWDYCHSLQAVQDIQKKVQVRIEGKPIHEAVKQFNDIERKVYDKSRFRNLRWGLIGGFQSENPNMNTVRWLVPTIAAVQKEIKQKALDDLLKPLDWVAVRQKTMDLYEEHDWSGYNVIPSRNDWVVMDGKNKGQRLVELSEIDFMEFVSQKINVFWKQKHEEAIVLLRTEQLKKAGQNLVVVKPELR